MEQSRLGSLIEVVINVVIGFIITLMANPIIYPMFGHSFTAMQNIGITLIFTVLSIVRGYCIRRWANARIKKTAAKIAEAALRKGK